MTTSNFNSNVHCATHSYFFRENCILVNYTVECWTINSIFVQNSLQTLISASHYFCSIWANWNHVIYFCQLMKKLSNGLCRIEPVRWSRVHATKLPSKISSKQFKFASTVFMQVRSWQILFMCVLLSNEIEKICNLLICFWLHYTYIYLLIFSVLRAIVHRDNGMFWQSLTASWHFSPKQLNTSVVKLKKKFPSSNDGNTLL